MSTEFLTPQQLITRWSKAVTIGTLANWRSKRVGPSYTKMRGRILYPVASVKEWEQQNMQHLLAANDQAQGAAA